MKLFQVALLFVGLSAGQVPTGPATVVRPATLTTSAVPRFTSRFGSPVGTPGLPISSGIPLRAPVAPLPPAPKVSEDAKKDAKKAAEKAEKIAKAEAAVAKAEETLTAKNFGVTNKMTGAITKSTILDDADDKDDVKLFSKINSYQEAYIGEQQKADALNKVLSDPEAKESAIEKAEMTHRSAQLKATYKALEAVTGESHKKRTDAGAVALGMRSVDARITNAAYETARADPNYDPKKLEGLKLKRDIDQIELLAQGSYVRENPDNAHILYLKTNVMKEPGAEAALEKAWEAFNEDPSEENDIKLTLAEINLDIIRVGKTQNYIKYKGTLSLLDAFLGTRIAKLKREAADLQLELKMMALNKLYGTTGPVVTPSLPYGPMMQGPYYTVAAQTQPVYSQPQPVVYSPYYQLSAQTQP